MTREVIIGLVANIETREQRRANYAERSLPAEHPHASSTDDVEGMRCWVQFLTSETSLMKFLKS